MIMNTLVKNILTVLLIIAGNCLLAQSPADKLFDTYAAKDGYTSVYITKHMFSLFAELDTPEEEDSFAGLIKTLDCIKIIAVEKESDNTKKSVNFFTEIMSALPAKAYEELMIVKSKDQNIKFLIRKEGELIKELLMVSGGENDNALVSIQGNIDLKAISKLSRTMNIKGLEKMDALDNQKN